MNCLSVSLTCLSKSVILTGCDIYPGLVFNADKDQIRIRLEKVENC